MIKALFLGIIKFVIKLMELILTPFISVVTGLFPEVSVFFGYITSFLNKALTYVGLILDLFLVPRGAIALLFDFWIISSSIYLAILSVKFFVNVYQKFKM
jgi:hypothetical protein